MLCRGIYFSNTACLTRLLSAFVATFLAVRPVSETKEAKGNRENNYCYSPRPPMLSDRSNI